MIYLEIDVEFPIFKFRWQKIHTILQILWNINFGKTFSKMDMLLGLFA